jgi:hypothetical protein
MVAFGKLCGEALLFTVVALIIVGVMGNLNKWETSTKYSNAFFIAGALVIIGGLSSRMAAGKGWEAFQRIDAESFRGLSPAERANFIVEASSSLRLVIVTLMAGILLIILSLLVWDRF